MDYSLLENFEEDAPLSDGFQPARNKTAEKQARQTAYRQTKARALQNLSLGGGSAKVSGNFLLPGAGKAAKPAAHTQSQFIPARPCTFYQQGKCRYGNVCTFAHVSAKQAAEMTSQLRPNSRTSNGQQPWSTMAALEHQAAQSGNNSNFGGGQSEHGLYKTSICTFWHQNKDSCVRGDSCSFAHGVAELRRPNHFQKGPVQMPFIKTLPTALPREPAHVPAGEQQQCHPSFDQGPLPPRDPESTHSEAYTHHPQSSSALSSATAVLPDDEDDVWEMCNDLIRVLTQQRGPAAPHPTVAPLHAPRPYIPGSTAVESRRQNQPKPAPYNPPSGEASVGHPGSDIVPNDESSARNQQQQQLPQQQPPSLPQMSKRQAKKLRQQATPPQDPSQTARYDLLLPREKESDAAETKPQSPHRPLASNAAADNSNRATATTDHGHANTGSINRVANGTAHHPSSPQVNLGFDEEDDIDSSFQCALTLEIMEDPVVCADGHSYERAVIKNWLATHDTSPLTGLTLPHKELVTNRAVKKAIEMRRQPRV